MLKTNWWVIKWKRKEKNVDNSNNCSYFFGLKVNLEVKIITTKQEIKMTHNDWDGKEANSHLKMRGGPVNGFCENCRWSKKMKSIKKLTMNSQKNKSFLQKDVIEGISSERYRYTCRQKKVYVQIIVVVEGSLSWRRCRQYSVSVSRVRHQVQLRPRNSEN